MKRTSFLSFSVYLLLAMASVTISPPPALSQFGTDPDTQVCDAEGDACDFTPAGLGGPASDTCCDDKQLKCDTDKGKNGRDGTCVKDKEEPKCKKGNDTCTPKKMLNNDTKSDCCEGVCQSDTKKCSSATCKKPKETCKPQPAGPGMDGPGDCCYGICDSDTKKCDACIQGKEKECKPGGGMMGSDGPGNCCQGVCDSKVKRCVISQGQADEIEGKYKDEKLKAPPKPPCLSEGGKGQCLQLATAFGKMSTDPAAFVANVFAILLSISGGVGALLIIRAGYRIMISQGKPEQLQQGRDDLIAAIVGIVFLIFSFVILQVIGVDILALPGFK